MDPKRLMFSKSRQCHLFPQNGVYLKKLVQMWLIFLSLGVTFFILYKVGAFKKN
jgi:hypothetical protein